ncbi:MAG: nitrate reductase cytochrome c-type subunit [Duodenibacillus sp.]|nr:nitrate reductase cytochrome c-type subunit [Duodenibacillus sp.]
MNKLIASLAVALAGSILCAGAQAADAIDIDKTSLEQTSPFEVPAPKAFEYTGGQFRETPMGTPAVVIHDVSNYKISLTRNDCMLCHGNYYAIGKPKIKGAPTAIPQSHWRKDAKGKLFMGNNRHQCDLCHAQQANVKPLVETQY